MNFYTAAHSVSKDTKEILCLHVQKVYLAENVYKAYVP